MEVEVIKAIQNIRNPFLDALFSAITVLGDEMFFIIVGAILYWCFDKRFGYKFINVYLLGNACIEGIKSLVARPRPYTHEGIVSVTERTKEIGVRMAIGARRFNVLQQFLIEAVLICIIGGFTGVLASAGIGALFNAFVKDFPMSFSTGSIVLALTCSTLIGVIFGYMPARRASMLNPVEALAQE